MTKAKLVSDNDGHDYLIPIYLSDIFQEYLDTASDEDFWEQFGHYMIEGDFEIFANFENL